MATTPHSGLTGANLHEPKGVAAAAANTIYIPDGAGSGAFAKLTHSQLQTTGNPFGGQLLQVREEQVSGTAGSAITSGSWITRVLNTSVTNEISGASLASNQITLPSGTYFIDGTASLTVQSATTVKHQLRLFNATDASAALVGLTAQVPISDSNNGPSGNSHSFVRGRFTIASQKTFQLEHRTTQTGTGGTAASWGTEVYADVCIWKVA